MATILDGGIRRHPETLEPVPRQDGMANGELHVTARLVLVVAALTAGSFVAEAHAPGTWTLTPPMGAARFAHTATLLPSGQVLVTGGRDSTGTLNSAEIFDPSNETWSPTGSMATSRSFHTATLLPNGLVLITGGYLTADIASATAEIYDPQSGTFEAAGSMAAPRASHTALALPDGTVLLAGGFDGEIPEASAEIYDPNTGAFFGIGATSTPPAARSVLLPNGLVLLPGLTGSTESYDPSSQTFLPTAPLASARGDVGNTLLLPNGKVLVAGGADGSGSGLASAELYDPAAETFTGAGALGTPRRHHETVLLPNGTVLVSGGWSEAGGVTLGSVEIYDPDSDAFSEADALGNARGLHTATLLPNGHVLVVGGTENATPDSDALASSEIYCPVAPGPTEVWLPVGGSLNIGRHSHEALLLPSLSLEGSADGSVEIYQPETETFIPAGTLSSAQGSRETATLLANGLVFAAGGGPSGASSFVSLYNPADQSTSSNLIEKNLSLGGVLEGTRTLHTVTGLANGNVLIAGGASDGPGVDFADLLLPSLTACDLSGTSPCAVLTTIGTAGIAAMVQPRSHHTATLLPDGRVLIVGGIQDATGLATSVAELYDGGFVGIEAMSTGRFAHTATLLPNGLVLVVGGRDDIGNALTSAELYEPVTGVWTAVAGALGTARAFHTATRLPNGLVMISGGEDASGDVLGSVELFDPVNNAFQPASPLITPRSRHSTTLLADGYVLTAGGIGPLEAALDSAELYASRICATPPEAPTNITATPSISQQDAIDLSWDPSVSGSVTEQRLYRGTAGGGPYELVATIPGNDPGRRRSRFFHIDGNLAIGSTYYYVVRAFDGVLESEDSNEASDASLDAAPEPPNSLEATDALDDTGGAITLSWSLSPSEEVIEQRVKRSATSGGPYALVATIPSDISSFTDVGLTDGEIYFFVVTNHDGTFESDPSGEASAEPRDNSPQAFGLSVTTGEDAAGFVTLDGSDPDGDALTFAVVAGPTEGTLTGDAPSLTYAPNADFNGTDSFTFTVSDGTLTSSEATVLIDVSAVNDAPVTTSQNVSTDEDLVLAISLAGNDAENDPLTFSVVSGPADGVLIGVAPDLTYVPNADFYGTDSFAFTVNDGDLTSGEATVVIDVTGVNDAPVATAGVAATSEDTPASITLTGSDAENDPLTFTVVNGPANGVLTGAAPDLTYTPTADFYGADSFTFTASDADLTSGEATIAIDVTGVNDAPVATTAVATTSEDTSTSITLTGSDAENDPLTFTVVNGPANGVLTGAAPDLTYTPTADFYGADSFTFTTSDADLTSGEATIAIDVTGVNDVPVATAGVAATSEDTPASITLTGSDAENDPLTFTVVNGPANGVLTGAAPDLTYTPTADFYGADTFTFTTSDADLTSGEATIAIDVTGVNDAPVATAGVAGTSEDTPASITLTGSDAENDPLTFTVVNGPANGVLTGAAPDLTYTPTADFFGADSFTFSASDADLTSGEATIAIDVTGVNDAPVATAGVAGTSEDTPASITLTGSDAENDPLTFTVVNGPANGVLTGAAPDLTYTPTADFYGADSFTFTASDADLTSGEATIAIDVCD